MRRTELEQALRALGWDTTGETIGRHGVVHTVWRHGKRNVTAVLVPDQELVRDDTANQIIATARARARR